MTFANTISHFTKKPEKLFLTDALGAAISAVILAAVLGNFSNYFGMPQNVINLLSGIAVMLCTYSLLCYGMVKKQQAGFITIMSRANFLYCILTAVFVVMHFQNLTVLGLSYFLIEMIIICTLVYIEFKVAEAIKNNIKEI
jgi:hypothetical protein